MKIEVTLRPANEKDTNRIKDLIREGEINPMGLDWQRFTLAVGNGGEIIGCGQIKPHQDGSVELASLVVTKIWRKKGVARVLVEELLTQHSGDLYLMCQSSLGPFYQQYHFKPVPEENMPKYFRRISKLVGFFEPLTKKGETLLVMMHKD